MVIIDCDSCINLAKKCGDCIISYMTTEAKNDSMQIELTVDECNAINRLSRAGMIYPIKYDDGKVFSYGN